MRRVQSGIAQARRQGVGTWNFHFSSNFLERNTRSAILMNLCVCGTFILTYFWVLQVHSAVKEPWQHWTYILTVPKKNAIVMLRKLDSWFYHIRLHVAIAIVNRLELRFFEVCLAHLRMPSCRQSYSAHRRDQHFSADKLNAVCTARGMWTLFVVWFTDHSSRNTAVWPFLGKLNSDFFEIDESICIRHPIIN